MIDSVIQSCFAGIKAPKTVDLQGVQLGIKQMGVFLSALEFNTNIKSLHLDSQGINNLYSDMLYNLLYYNKSLEHLYLSNNSIAREGLTKIKEAALSSQSLKTLDLSGNNINDDSITSLLSYLWNLRSLESLNLSDNYIGFHGAKHIAEFLAKSLNLKQIDLSDNYIDADAAVWLSKGLSLNYSIASINLSNNNLGDIGAISILSALVDRNYIECLALNNVGLTDESIDWIIAIIKSCVNLKALDLSKNVFSDKSIEKLAHALLMNQQISEFYVDTYCCGNDAFDLMSDAVSAHSGLLYTTDSLNAKVFRLGIKNKKRYVNYNTGKFLMYKSALEYDESEHYISNFTHNDLHYIQHDIKKLPDFSCLKLAPFFSVDYSNSNFPTIDSHYQSVDISYYTSLPSLEFIMNSKHIIKPDAYLYTPRH